ncbi:hypothetical protein LTR50_004178 [Elasticomyces elasticus]|nr:hypothetical protein LTR50_004178 [Elasticomyces elasticus]
MEMPARTPRRPSLDEQSLLEPDSRRTSMVFRALASNDSQPKSPLHGFGFLKNLSSDKKSTKDGQTPKRRGPKPDSKPALTRRQELNRQAQRTHRERKEMYIKALEQEVLRLKETFGCTAKERDAIAEENRRLKELLAAHGITYDSASPHNSFQRVGSSYGGSSSGSISGSYRPASNSTGLTPPPLLSQSHQQQHLQLQPTQRQNMAQLPLNNIDYDQIGIDFVLTYDFQGRPIYSSPPPHR